MSAAIVAAIVGIALLSLTTTTKSAKRGEEGFDSWTESRVYGNDMYEKYPPCYDICGATRSIFDILENAGVQEKHAGLLDAYSTVLCQEKFIENACGTGPMLLRRINSLPPAPRGASEIVDKYHPEASGLSKEFLLRITGVLERELKKIKSDPRLNARDKAKITKLHDTFLVVHYHKINGC